MIDRTKYLALFHSDENIDRIFNRRWLFVMKNNNSDVYSHKRAKIKSNLDNNLPLEKTLYKCKMH